MSTEDIIHQNNRVLRFLMVNDFANAIRSACTAVQLQQDLYLASGDILEPDACALGLDQCMMLSEAPGDQNQLPSGIHGMIYHFGIPIPPTERRPFRISQIILFNAALAHHLSAETSGNQETMNKAKILYQMLCNPEDITESPLFQFAVINNLGLIERRLGNASDQYFDLLPSLLNRIFT